MTTAARINQTREQFEAYLRSKNACVRLHRQREELGGFYRTTTVQRSWELWLAALASQAAQVGAEPAGWKLVPVEPTELMISAGTSRAVFPASVYRAMLAAAPTPTSES